jgi:hypothetical protein
MLCGDSGSVCQRSACKCLGLQYSLDVHASTSSLGLARETAMIVSRARTWETKKSRATRNKQVIVLLMKVIALCCSLSAWWALGVCCSTDEVKK